MRSDARAGLKLRVVRADPRTMKPEPPKVEGAPAGEAEAPVVLGLEAAPRGDSALWWSKGVFSVAINPPTKDAMRVAGGYPMTAAAAATARAAAGVQDEDGMLVWVELPPDAKPDAQTTAAMDALLEKLGCSARVALAGDARALLGGSLDAAGNPLAAAPPPTVLRFVRARAPDAHAFFESTPLVDIEVWRPLQAKRVRYFYKPTPSASAAAPASGAAPSAPAPPTQTTSHGQSPR